jgi:hypothetical protein
MLMGVKVSFPALVSQLVADLGLPTLAPGAGAVWELEFDGYVRCHFEFDPADEVLHASAELAPTPRDRGLELLIRLLEANDPAGAESASGLVFALEPVGDRLVVQRRISAASAATYDALASLLTQFIESAKNWKGLLVSGRWQDEASAHAPLDADEAASAPASLPFSAMLRV